LVVLLLKVIEAVVADVVGATVIAVDESAVTVGHLVPATFAFDYFVVMVFKVAILRGGWIGQHARPGVLVICIMVVLAGLNPLPFNDLGVCSSDFRLLAPNTILN